MTDVPRATMRKRSAFFILLAVALSVTLLLGFARSFYLQPFFGAPPLTVAFIIHGIFGSAWFAMLIGQVWLVRAGKTAEHRKLGAFAPWLVGAIILSTFGVIWVSLALSATGSGLPRHAGLFLQLSTTIWFVGFFLLGWFNRNRPDVHKRALMLATIAMMAPAFSRISRLFRDGGPPPFDSAFLAAFFIGAMVVHDLRSSRRIHHVTLYGGIGYLLWVAVRQPFAKSEAWAAFAVPFTGS